MKPFFHLGQEVKKLRGWSEMSQVEFAKLLKIHPQALSNCERGISGLPKRSFMILKKKYPTYLENIIETFYSDGSNQIREKLKKTFGSDVVRL